MNESDITLNVEEALKTTVLYYPNKMKAENLCVKSYEMFSVLS